MTNSELLSYGVPPIDKSGLNGSAPIVRRELLQFVPLESAPLDVISQGVAREQLRTLARWRARKREGDNYKGGYEKKDQQWAARLIPRRAKAHTDWEILSSELRQAYENKNKNSIRKLENRRDRVLSKLAFIESAFGEAGVTVDSSRIPQAPLRAPVESRVTTQREAVVEGERPIAQPLEVDEREITAAAKVQEAAKSGLPKESVTPRRALSKAILPKVQDITSQARRRAKEIEVFSRDVAYELKTLFGARKQPSTWNMLLVLGGAALAGPLIGAMINWVNSEPNAFAPPPSPQPITETAKPRPTTVIFQKPAEAPRGEVVKSLPRDSYYNDEPILQALTVDAAPLPGGVVASPRRDGYYAERFEDVQLQSTQNSQGAVELSSAKVIFESKAVVNPGDTLWSIIARKVGKGWVNPQNGVPQAGVVADMISKFLRANGQNPDSLTPGQSIDALLSTLSDEQKQLVEAALNTKSVEEYRATVMPRFQAMI